MGIIFALQGSANFGIAFAPKKNFREIFMNKPSDEKNEIGSPDTSGKMILNFATGQSLHIPVSKFKC